MGRTYGVYRLTEVFIFKPKVMSMNKKIATESASPSLEGGKGWVSILKVLIAVLTAIAGSLGIVSCM